jgi:hypothetical protein
MDHLASGPATRGQRRILGHGDDEDPKPSTRIFMKFMTIFWQRKTDMDSHFFLSVGLIIIAFSLCFWFRKEK